MAKLHHGDHECYHKCRELVLPHTFLAYLWSLGHSWSLASADQYDANSHTTFVVHFDWPIFTKRYHSILPGLVACTTHIRCLSWNQLFSRRSFGEKWAILLFPHMERQLIFVVHNIHSVIGIRDPLFFGHYHAASPRSQWARLLGLQQRSAMR